jgi:hypothetical protein
MALQTEFDFTLPKGYVDNTGALHRHGTMRLATARDEILPMRDPRVQANEAYLTVVILSRVITKLGTLTTVSTGVIEELFAADLAYLQDFYGIINFGDPSVLLEATEPEEDADVPLAEGSSGGTPDDESPDRAETPAGRRRGSVEEILPEAREA